MPFEAFISEEFPMEESLVEFPLDSTTEQLFELYSKYPDLNFFRKWYTQIEARCAVEKQIIDSMGCMHGVYTVFNKKNHKDFLMFLYENKPEVRENIFANNIFADQEYDDVLLRYINDHPEYDPRELLKKPSIFAFYGYDKVLHYIMVKYPKEYIRMDFFYVRNGQARKYHFKSLKLYCERNPDYKLCYYIKPHYDFLTWYFRDKTAGHFLGRDSYIFNSMNGNDDFFIEVLERSPREEANKLVAYIFDQFKAHYCPKAVEYCFHNHKEAIPFEGINVLAALGLYPEFLLTLKAEDIPIRGEECVETIRHRCTNELTRLDSLNSPITFLKSFLAVLDTGEIENPLEFIDRVPLREAPKKYPYGRDNNYNHDCREVKRVNDLIWDITDKIFGRPPQKRDSLEERLERHYGTRLPPKMGPRKKDSIWNSNVGYPTSGIPGYY